MPATLYTIGLYIIKLEFCEYYGSMLISIFIFWIYFTAPSVKGINCDCLVACKFASKIRPVYVTCKHLIWQRHFTDDQSSSVN